VPVEFAGWMPVFERFGDCGRHPLFAHAATPPEGYRFVSSDPRQAPAGRWDRLRRACWKPLRAAGMMLHHAFQHGFWRWSRTLLDAGRFFWALVRKGYPLGDAARFVHSRHFGSQVMLPRSGLVFLTSVPFTYGQNPWAIEIEDSTTLFYPYLRNGETDSGDPRALSYFGMVKELLESPRCRAIVTHVRSTAESLPTLFQSETIAKKVFHIPLGVELPRRPVRQMRDETINLLFTNSWHQEAKSFYLRGGLDVLEAFAVLRERYPQLRLVLRSSLPDLPRRYMRMLLRGDVQVLGNFLSARQMDALQRRTHIYLLPSARVHIVSLLQAMAYGQAVIASDGWGFAEHVEHGRNGLVVPGRHGKTSWLDERGGLLREDYRPMFRPDPVIVEGLVESVSRLVEDSKLRRRLGKQARADVAARHSVAQWNERLKAVFDQVTHAR
jgi:glycosyltransferase involved in cell wall biosynthesis